MKEFDVYKLFQAINIILPIAIRDTENLIKAGHSGVSMQDYDYIAENADLFCRHMDDISVSIERNAIINLREYSLDEAIKLIMEYRANETA